MEFYIHLYAVGSFLLGFGTLVWWVTATILERRRLAEYAKRKDFELERIIELEACIYRLESELREAKGTIRALEIKLNHPKNDSI